MPCWTDGAANTTPMNMAMSPAMPKMPNPGTMISMISRIMPTTKTMRAQRLVWPARNPLVK